MLQYRLLDRSTNAAIFFASLLMATTVFGSVSMAFGPGAPTLLDGSRIEEVVVRG